MLSAVETFYGKALQEALQSTWPGLAVSLGPSLGPPASGERRVDVSAENLSLTPPKGVERWELREPAWFSDEYRFPSDGKSQEFPLPEDVQGEVVEVESPPGHPLRRGDAYVLEGRVLRFYRPPEQAEVAVVVLVRGGRARGFIERCPCELVLALSAWGQVLAEVDSLLSAMVAKVLSASTRQGTLQGTVVPGSAVRFRLLQPEVSLQGFSRRRERAEAQDWLRARAFFLVRGELEQVVVVGQPEPVRLIREVERKLQVLKPQKELERDTP
jgi:hypothetical protein